MKMFGKRLVAGCSAFAVIMSANAFGMLQTTVSAETNAPVPKITGEWQQDTQATADGSKYWLTYPRTADMTVEYDDSAYDGKYSLTAVYDGSNRLVGTGGGAISGGKAEYKLNVSNSSGVTVKNYIWDETSLKPETAAYETEYDELTDDFTFKVPEVTKPEETAYVLRSSFENGTFNYFNTDGLDSNTKLEITDEVAANTGTKCVKISDRTYEWHTLKTTLKAEEVGKTGKLHVEAYMKKPEAVAKANFYIQVQVKTDDGVKYPSGTWINNVEDTSWHKVSADIDLSSYENLPEKDGWYTVLFNCSGPNGTRPDFYVDDVKIVCEGSDKEAFFDDMTNGELNWDFEDGNGTTSNRYLSLMSDLHKWSSTQANADEHSAWSAQAISVADADEIAGNDTLKALKLESTSAWTTGHMTARVKVSKLDFVPGKEYELKFKAASNNATDWRNDALYAGLAPHRDSAMSPSGFSGRDAGILKKAEDDRYANRVGAIAKSTWQEFTYSFTPTADDFNSEGFADLCILITMDPVKHNQWHTGGQITTGDALYLDDISIKPVDKTVPEITKDTWVRRASFEEDTLDMFVKQTDGIITLTNKTSHTGKYSAKVSNRQYEWNTLRVMLDGVDTTSKVTASVWVKNTDDFTSKVSDGKVTYKIQLHVPKGNADGTNVWWEQGISVTDTKWTKLEQTIDLSQYTGEDADWSEAYISLKTYPNTIDYYADDFLIVSDKKGDGTVYDDTVVATKDDSISDTASNGTSYREDAAIDSEVEDIAALSSKYDFKIGAAIWNNAQNTEKYGKLFAKHFNAAVSNGLFKPADLLGDSSVYEPEYNFAPADKMMKYCLENNITDVTGHTLMYFDGSLCDKYFLDEDENNIFTSSEEVQAFMQSYISALMTHFSGCADDDEYDSDVISKSEMSEIGISVWDVVNEAINDASEEHPEWDYNSKMYELKEPYLKEGKDQFEVVRDAFRIAAAVREELGLEDKVELRYNDYYGTDVKKAAAAVDLVKSITDDNGNCLVDRIGVQSHYSYATDYEGVCAVLDKLSEAGIKIDVSELEVSAYTGAERAEQLLLFENGITKEREFKQAKLLRSLFDKYQEMYEAGKLDRVVFWTWIDSPAYNNTQGYDHKDYAGMFDRQYKAKPQYYILTMTDADFNAKYPEYKTYTE